MKKKRVAILGLQVALIAGTSFAFVSYTQNEVKPTDVYVFNKDLDVNTKIMDGDIKKVSIPRDAVQKEFTTDKEKIVGKYVTTKAFENQFVYSKQIVKKDNVDPFESMDMSKLRKVSLPISFLDGFAGNVKRGDSIDLVYTGEGKKNGDSFNYSKVFLQNVIVYGVATDDGYKYQDRSTKIKGEVSGKSNGEKIDTKGDKSKIAVITLAVTLDQAEEISTRLNTGEIRFAGRFEENQSYETLGFVIGQVGKIFAEKSNAETGRATINEVNEFQK